MLSKIIYNIHCLVFLTCFFTQKISAQSIDIPQEETTETAAPEIAAPFVQSELLSSEVMAFQDRAPQKLQDFTDYIQLLSDQRNEEEVKMVTRKALVALFQKKEATIQFYHFEKKKKQSVLLSDFLAHIETQKRPLSITFHDCENAPNLEANDKQYRWTVPCKWQWSSGEETVYTVMIFEAFLVKKEKQFGSRMMEVWEVLLGDVLDLKIL